MWTTADSALAMSRGLRCSSWIQCRIGGSAFGEQVSAVLTPERVSSGAQPSPGSARLVEQDEVQLCDVQVEVGRDEGGQSGPGRCARTERRSAPQHPLLQFTLTFVEQRKGY